MNRFSIFTLISAFIGSVFFNLPVLAVTLDECYKTSQENIEEAKKINGYLAGNESYTTVKKVFILTNQELEKKITEINNFNVINSYNTPQTSKKISSSFAPCTENTQIYIVTTTMYLTQEKSPSEESPSNVYATGTSTSVIQTNIKPHWVSKNDNYAIWINSDGKKWRFPSVIKHKYYAGQYDDYYIDLSKQPFVEEQRGSRWVRAYYYSSRRGLTWTEYGKPEPRVDHNNSPNQTYNQTPNPGRPSWQVICQRNPQAYACICKC